MFSSLLPLCPWFVLVLGVRGANYVREHWIFFNKKRLLLPLLSLYWQWKNSFMSQAWFCNSKIYRVSKTEYKWEMEEKRKESKRIWVNNSIVLWQNILASEVLCGSGFTNRERKVSMNSKNHIFAREINFYFSNLKLETLWTLCELGPKLFSFSDSKQKCLLRFMGLGVF